MVYSSMLPLFRVHDVKEKHAGDPYDPGDHEGRVILAADFHR